MPYTVVMSVRKSARREVRLNEEYNAALEENLRQRDITFTAWLREKIDADREELALGERLAAVARIAGMNVEFHYDPDESDPVTRILDENEAAEAREQNPIA